VKILHVTPVFYPAKAFGGIVGVSYEITKILAKRGHEVTVYSTDANKGSRIEKKFDNISEVDVYYFRNLSNYLAWNNRLFLPLEMILAIKSNIKNFDVIHIHDYRTLLSVVVSHYARKFGIPYILQPHGAISSNVSKRTFKKVFDLIFGKKILEHSSRVIALNKTEAEICENLGVRRSNIVILPNGINLAGYKNLPKKGEFKSRYEIHEKESIILYVGRIDKSKGIDLLVKVFANILKRIDNAKLVIIGIDDGYLSILKDMINSLKIEDKVIFTGFVPEKEKLAAYVDADVFVTPTFYGFPLTFLEAMACGVPIVTTNKGDYIEGINNEIGFVVNYNEKELKNAILKILTNDKLRENFKRNCREKIKRHDWSIITAKMERIYNLLYKGGTNESPNGIH